MFLKKVLLFALFLLFGAGVQTTTGQTPVPLGLEEVVWQKDYLPKKIISAKFTPEGNTIIIALSKGIVEVSAVNGEIIREFQGELNNDIEKMDVSKTGTKICATNISGYVGIWDYITGKLDTTFYDASCVAISPDDKYMLYGHYSTTKNITVVNIQSMTIIDTLTVNGAVHSISYSPDGKYFATGSGSINSNDNQIYDRLVLWDANTFTPIQELEFGFGEIHNICFSEDSKMLLYSRKNYEHNLWDLVKLKLYKKYSAEILGFNSGRAKIFNNYLIFNSGISNQTSKIYSLLLDSILFDYNIPSSNCELQNNKLILYYEEVLILLEPI